MNMMPAASFCCEHQGQEKSRHHRPGFDHPAQPDAPRRSARSQSVDGADTDPDSGYIFPEEMAKQVSSCHLPASMHRMCSCLLEPASGSLANTNRAQSRMRGKACSLRDVPSTARILGESVKKVEPVIRQVYRWRQLRDSRH